MTTIETENRQAIGRIYQNVRSEIFRIFRQACIAEDTCEDLVQEVFVKILGLDIVIESQLKGLAIQIAYQKRVDYLRRRACMYRIHDELGWSMEQSYSHTDAEVNDILRIEMQAIECMSEKDARIYQLTRFEEKSADEIVLETGLSKRAVESRIYRTRIQVREAVRHAMNF